MSEERVWLKKFYGLDTAVLKLVKRDVPPALLMTHAEAEAFAAANGLTIVHRRRGVVTGIDPEVGR